jgi:hypothetical protein
VLEEAVEEGLTFHAHDLAREMRVEAMDQEQVRHIAENAVVADHDRRGEHVAHVAADAERRIVLVAENAADEHRVIDDLAGKPRGTNLDVVHRDRETDRGEFITVRLCTSEAAKTIERVGAHELQHAGGFRDARSAPGGVTLGRPFAWARTKF